MGETEARERSRFSNFGGPTHGLPHLFHYLARPGAKEKGERGAISPLLAKNWDEGGNKKKKREDGGGKSEKIEK